jgi:hypothetical protein
MPQRSRVQAKKKVRATRRLAKWRAKQEQQQAAPPPEAQAAAAKAAG